MAYDLSKYQTVQQRIDLFWLKYPQGRFNIEIVHLSETQVVMKAEVWTDWAEELPRCVDYAEERVATKGVNLTSHIENCSTSVLGRAISQLGGELSPTGAKPSREEMAKVQRLTDAQYWDLAQAAVEVKDLTRLRELYNEAKAGNASQELLVEITNLANGFKSAQDTAK